MFWTVFKLFAGRIFGQKCLRSNFNTREFKRRELLYVFLFTMARWLYFSSNFRTQIGASYRPVKVKN